MREPPGDECDANVVKTFEHGGYAGRWMAAFYPQMGGYVGKCWVSTGEPVGDGDSCFDVLIWHDGSFPFSEEAGDSRDPIRLHHCSPMQFIEFGEKILRARGARDVCGERLGASRRRLRN